MSVNTVLSPAGIAAMRAYRQVKQHGEPLPDKSEALALLEREQLNAGTEAGKAINAESPTTALSTEEQRQTQLELERSWGLMSAILGTQFDEYA